MRRATVRVWTRRLEYLLRAFAVCGNERSEPRAAGVEWRGRELLSGEGRNFRRPGMGDIYSEVGVGAYEQRPCKFLMLTSFALVFVRGVSMREAFVLRDTITR
jgi:hypothetical protein